LTLGFKDKEATNLHMQVNKLTYKDICAHEEDAYRRLFDRKEWPSAQHTSNSKAPPAAFRNIATPITRADVETSSSPSTQPTAPDLPRKESFTSATKLDIGLANALRIRRAKASVAMGMGMNDQRMSSPGSLHCLCLERLKSSKPMERLSTGVQAESAGLLPTPRQRTLVVAREVLMEQMVVVLQSTTFLLF
jgi:hypothetical protein